MWLPHENPGDSGAEKAHPVQNTVSNYAQRESQATARKTFKRMLDALDTEREPAMLQLQREYTSLLEKQIVR